MLAALHQGDVDGVVRAGDACLKVAPQATTCVHLRLWSYADYGRCTEYGDESHRLLAIDPQSTEGYQGLAQTGIILGRSTAGVWAAERMAWKHAPPDQAAWGEALDRVALAVLTGDLQAVEKAIADLERMLPERTDGWDRLNAALAEVNTYTELGALERAARAADAFLAASETVAADPGLDLYAIEAEDQPLMFKALVRAGKMKPEELDRRRAAWIDAWRGRLDPSVARYLWIYGWAIIVDTAAEAAQALAVLPEYEPLPLFRAPFVANAHIGRTYLLAGRPAEAIPLLRRATAQCDVFEDPIAWVQASLWLGEALEAQGQKDEACAAYSNVVTRWKGFGARSTSYREARKRMAGLQCSLK
jgi:serine/threonine-protein kinase